MSDTPYCPPKPRDRWWSGSGWFLIILHLTALIGLPFYFYFRQPGWPMIVATAAVLYTSLIGITAVYHRMYAHRAYQMAKPAEAIFLFFGTVALQGSVVRWSFDHRMHHRFVDHDGDPYNVKRGFWHAHVLWMFRPQAQIDDSVRDLLANRLVRFQDQHYLLLTIASNLLVTLLIGWWLDDLTGAFALVLVLRLVLSYNITWCINSLAHYWGAQSYSKELSARDNYIVAMITVGEGYHNYHHTFPGDYRNGIHWYHVDPGKWVVWLLSKVGLTTKLNRQPKAKILQTLVNKDTNLLLRRLQDAGRAGAADVRTKLEARFGPLPTVEAMVKERSAALKEKIDDVARLHQEWRAKSSSRAEARELRRRLAQLKRDQKSRWSEWARMCEGILRT